MNELYQNLYEFLSIINDEGFELIDGRYISALSELELPKNYTKFYINNMQSLGQKHNTSYFDETDDMYSVRYNEIYRCYLEFDFLGDPSLTDAFQTKLISALLHPEFVQENLNLFVIERLKSQKDLNMEIGDAKVNLNKVIFEARFELDFSYKMTTIETVGDVEMEYDESE